MRVFGILILHNRSVRIFFVEFCYFLALNNNIRFSIVMPQATQSTQPPNVLDLSGGGRASLPASLAQHAADAFTVRVLRLQGNSLGALPAQVLGLSALTHLDISDNRLAELPAEMNQLTQ